MSETTVSNELICPDVLQHMLSCLVTSRPTLTTTQDPFIHGCSMETLAYVLAERVFPGVTVPNMQSQLGDLYVHANSNIFSQEQQNILFRGQERYLPTIDREQLLLQTGIYAENIAQRHALLTLLGLSLQDSEVDAVMGILWSITQEGLSFRTWRREDTNERIEKVQAFFDSHAITESEFLAASGRAKTARGFLCTFSVQALHQQGYRIKPPSPRTNRVTDEGIIIHTQGRGVDYTCLAKVYPQGEHERRFLKSLKQLI